MTLSDLEKRVARGQHAHTIWPRTTKFGMVTRYPEARDSKGLAMPRPKGRGPNVSKTFGTHIYACMVQPRATNFGIETHV